MRKITVDGTGEFGSLVSSHIETMMQCARTTLRIGVPGGRSAAGLVHGILACSPAIVGRITVYLVDERLSGSTNRDTLLHVGLGEAIAKGLFKENQLVVPHAGMPFVEDGGKLDLLYLGVGEDGHVASLFPGSYPALDAMDAKDIAYVDDSPKPPAERVTVTYRALRHFAKHTRTYLLFFGEGKRAALDRLLAGRENPSTLPCMFFPREWFPVDIITDLKETAV